MKHNLNNTRGLDTNRYNIDTQKLDFSTANFSPAELEKQNQDLVHHANDFLTDKDNGWQFNYLAFGAVPHNKCGASLALS